MSKNTGKSAALAAVFAAVIVSAGTTGCGGGGESVPGAAELTVSTPVPAASASTDSDAAATPDASPSVSSTASAASSAGGQPTGDTATHPTAGTTSATTANPTSADACAHATTPAQIGKCPPHPVAAWVSAVSCGGYDGRTLHLGVVVRLTGMIGDGWRVTFSDLHATVSAADYQVEITDAVPYTPPVGQPPRKGPSNYDLRGTLDFASSAGTAQLPVDVLLHCT